MMNIPNNKTTLFLGDLSAFCTERDIHEIFVPYGEILEIKIMRSEETHRNLSYGFIKFAHPTAAKKALNGLNGVLFCGRHLRIGWATYKNKKEPKLLQHHDRMDSSSVHVSYISYQLNCLITEESLRILFSSFGVVLDCSIKKSYIDENINRQCGYGFVHFSSSIEGIEAALASVKGLNDATLDGVSYKCSISHNLEKQLMELHSHQQRPDPMMGLGFHQGPHHQARHPSPAGMMGFPENTFPNHAAPNMRSAPRNIPAAPQSSYRVEAPYYNNSGPSWNNHGHHLPPAPYHDHREDHFSFNQQQASRNAEFGHVFDSIDRNLVSRYRQKYSGNENQFPGANNEQMYQRNAYPLQENMNYSRNNGPYGSPQESRLMGLESQFAKLDMNLHAQQQPPKSMLDEWLKPTTEELQERESLGSTDSSYSQGNISHQFAALEKTNSNSSTWTSLSSVASPLESPSFLTEWTHFSSQEGREHVAPKEIF